MPGSNAGYKYARINSATTTALGAFPRTLGRIILNAVPAAATIEIFDSNDGTGTSLGKWTQGAAAIVAPVTLIYDIDTNVGLSITTTGAVDILVAYR